jgi:hypothetical protein
MEEILACLVFGQGQLLTPVGREMDYTGRHSVRDVAIQKRNLIVRLIDPENSLDINR